MYDPTQEALASPEYQQNAALLDEQAGLNAKTYAQNRQDIINSYQQTLDSLNYGLKQAGLQARSAYGSRNLYNASGSLSGTGELVGTELTQPITRQFTAAQASHEANLNRLALEEQQGGLSIKAKKADLLSGVVANLRKAKADEAAAALEASKLPGGQIDTLKVTQDQQTKGRTLLYQRDLADAVKKYGNDAIIQIGKQKFLLSSKERADLAKAKKDLNKTPVTKDETVRALNTKLNKDLNAFKDIVVTSGQPGEGQVTREQIINALAEDYPHRSRADIAKEVYGAYGDTYR